MKVTDGALTPEFRELRLPLGTGLLGLVAQSGAPYFTEDYQADERFVHRDYIDTAVEGEQIRAILGVPLTVEGKVIGALLAVHRTVRPFPAGEVALLTSFAAHAAVALENARLFEQARAAVAAADEANAELRARSEATERAAHAHDLLTDVLLHGGGVVEVADVLAQVLGGRLAVYDDEGRLLAGRGRRAARPRGSPTRSTARRPPAAACRPATEPGWPSRPPATSTSARSCCAPAEPDGPARAPHARARGAGHGAGAALRPHRGRGREPGARRAAVRPRQRARPRPRPAAGAGPAAGRRPRRRPGGRRRRADGRGPDPQVARVAADLARELQGLGGVHDGLAVVLGHGEPLQVGETAARPAGRRDGRGRRRRRAGWKGSRSAWREARQTLAALLRLDRAGEVSDPAGLGLARLLLGGNGPQELEEFVNRTLGPVLRYDAARETQLAETLEAWFASGGALRETAERLHIHPNTVTQRLDRVGQLLGDGVARAGPQARRAARPADGPTAPRHVTSAHVSQPKHGVRTHGGRDPGHVASRP